MKYYIKGFLLILMLVAIIGVAQTCDRFDSFEHYLNVGYGNVPYK